MYKIEAYIYKNYKFTIFWKWNRSIFKNLVGEAVFSNSGGMCKEDREAFLSSCLHSFSGKGSDAPKGG